MLEESRKTFIIDASVILAYLLPDEGSEFITRLFHDYAQEKINLSAPSILTYEVLNGLKNALGKRLNKQQLNNLLEDYLNLIIEFVEINPVEVLRISIQDNLSVYDASYLSIANSKNYQLLTLDKTLQKLT